MTRRGKKSARDARKRELSRHLRGIFSPELGAMASRRAFPESDRRFDLVLDPSRARCAGHAEWRSSSFFTFLGHRVRIEGRRRCRRKVVIRTGGYWYCSRCIQVEPLPLWKEAPDLHWRPTIRDGYQGDTGWGFLSAPQRAMPGMRDFEENPEGHRFMSQREVQEALDLTPDELWDHMTHCRVKIAIGGAREPYYFYAIEVWKLAQHITRDAIARLSGTAGRNW